MSAHGRQLEGRSESPISRVPIFCAASLLLAGVVGAFSPALAAEAGNSLAAGSAALNAQQQRQWLIDCRAGRTGQAPVDCLREAGAVRAEQRRGRPQDSTDDATRARNALLRCQPQPESERAGSEKIARGEGTAEGSVSAGGVLRTLVETAPAPTVDEPAAQSHP
jgi:hypothetical protein